jgi:hypothetical protein
MKTDDVFFRIISLFTSSVDIIQISLEEDLSEVSGRYGFKIKTIPQQENYDSILTCLNSRDNLHIKILKDGSVLETFVALGNVTFSEYITGLCNDGLELDDEIEIELTITKKKIESIISIYYLSNFVDKLNSLSFLTFLNVWGKNLNKETLILENQILNSTEKEFCTNTLSLINKGSMLQCNGIGDVNRESRIHEARTKCHWDIENISLLPEDFFPYVSENSNDKLINLFQKVCLLFSCMYIFDYSSIKNESYSYKINGFKTFGSKIETLKIKDIKIFDKSYEFFYRIYQWIYLGGNTNDKVSIARNIVSLNFNPITLELSETTFEAIQSNFKIYERENVKQYIDVRNKLSEILIDLQTKIGKIVEGFIGDFKKNIITLITFFISVIAIRVVSKGDFVGGFTNEIIILSFSFLLISIGLLIYSRWELNQKVSMFEKHYSQLKDRYKDLLSPKELDAIFEQCNPVQEEGAINDISFIDKQKGYYTLLWSLSILILFITLLIIFFINNHLFLNISKILYALQRIYNY